MTLTAQRTIKEALKLCGNIHGASQLQLLADPILETYELYEDKSAEKIAQAIVKKILSSHILAVQQHQMKDFTDYWIKAVESAQV